VPTSRTSATSGHSGRLASACSLRISRRSLLFAGLAALGRQPRPSSPICCALGCPSGSAEPSRRSSASSCAAARSSRTSSRFEVARGRSPPFFDGQRGGDCGVREPVVAAGRAPAHRRVVGLVKIVVHSIGEPSGFERCLTKFTSRKGKGRGAWSPGSLATEDRSARDRGPGAGLGAGETSLATSASPVT
jgi:hypothetical protein